MKVGAVRLPDGPGRRQQWNSRCRTPAATCRGSCGSVAGATQAQLLKELLIKPEWVRIAVEWLNQEQRVEPVTKAEVEAALGSHGGDRRSPQARQDQGDNIPLKHGTQATYIRARLQRDYPEIAEALDRGEHRSARAAAIEAGIIKPVPTVRLVADMAAA